MSHGEFLAKTVLNVGKSCWIVTILPTILIYNI